MALAADSAPVRSKDFYFPDGNIVLRVENTLYKIYRGVLTRKSATFLALFEPSAEPESSHAVPVGQDDEHPILITDGTAQQWDAFIWAAFSGFDELERLHLAFPGPEKLLRLLYTALLANQFGCESLCSWALRNASLVVSKSTEADSSSTLRHDVPLSIVRALAELQQSNSIKDELLSWAEPFILQAQNRAIVNQLPVLRVAHGSGWHIIAANGYYRLVCGNASRWAELGLTEAEQLRLLRGYQYLNETKARFSTVQMQIKHSKECWETRGPINMQASPVGDAAKKDKKPDSGITCEEACNAAWSELGQDVAYRTYCSHQSLVDLIEEATHRRKLLAKALSAQENERNSLLVASCRLVKCRQEMLGAVDKYITAVRLAVRNAFMPDAHTFDYRTAGTLDLGKFLEHTPEKAVTVTPMHITQSPVASSSNGISSGPTHAGLASLRLPTASGTFSSESPSKPSASGPSALASDISVSGSTVSSDTFAFNLSGKTSHKFDFSGSTNGFGSPINPLFGGAPLPTSAPATPEAGSPPSITGVGSKATPHLFSFGRGMSRTISSPAARTKSTISHGTLANPSSGSSSEDLPTYGFPASSSNASGAGTSSAATTAGSNAQSGAP
ncbi:hypothetical protein BKA62DRAFT_203104 [Auriculariales sp. MPI-PUGE-AT-0066]|nr:hypothetical protein BKA62DRAFT_203104 [Auriculariales sp. MPI-PUGE-AT-0066]